MDKQTIINKIKSRKHGTFHTIKWSGNSEQFPEGIVQEIKMKQTRFVKYDSLPTTQVSRMIRSAKNNDEILKAFHCYENLKPHRKVLVSKKLREALAEKVEKKAGEEIVLKYSGTDTHDPSCPFIVKNKDGIEKLQCFNAHSHGKINRSFLLNGHPVSEEENKRYTKAFDAIFKASSPHNSELVEIPLDRIISLS